jgi:hypothetical protein
VETPSLTIAEATLAVPRARTAAAVPWYVWTSILAVFLGNFGAHWDISWHRSIGRDTFWSPPHIAIYAKGVLAGITFGYLILHTTFFERSRDDVVSIWGLKGPLGAFLAAWGGVAMITSAPFDDWWHNAYGLDVRIVSPPHVILILGGYAITTGALILVQALRARADAERRDALMLPFLLLGGFALLQMMTAVLEWTALPFQHTAAMYRALAVVVPVVLCACAAASGRRWACTMTSSVYTVFMLVLLWVLPLFQAAPKLGPVYQPITHLIPNGFPVLVIVPAIACDWLLWRMRSRPRWMTALVTGVTFIIVLLVVQWPFATFLQSPAARNAIFGSHYLSYPTPSTSLSATYRFRVAEATSIEFWRVMAIACAIAALGAWSGLGLGRWLVRIRR